MLRAAEPDAGDISSVGIVGTGSAQAKKEPDRLTAAADGQQVMAESGMQEIPDRGSGGSPRKPTADVVIGGPIPRKDPGEPPKKPDVKTKGKEKTSPDLEPTVPEKPKPVPNQPQKWPQSPTKIPVQKLPALAAETPEDKSIPEIPDKSIPELPRRTPRDTVKDALKAAAGVAKPVVKTVGKKVLEKIEKIPHPRPPEPGIPGVRDAD
ncbi:MAG: hypothetical protein ABSH20_12635 [Tepidisphaeraceae bacterium]